MQYQQPPASQLVLRGPATEVDLTLPRRKPRSVVISAAYRAKRLAVCLFGAGRMLRFCLNSSWLLWRFAFELTGEVFGTDFSLHSKGLSEEILARWIPKGGSVVDIGCGRGQWCYVAARYAARVVGIDYDAANIAAARERSSGAGIEYVVGDATRQLGDHSFDLALLTHVIEHIDDVDSLLLAIARIANRLIVEVPDFESDSLNRVRRAIGCPYYSDGDHVREYTLALLQTQLERNGWSVLWHCQRGGCVLVVAEQAATRAGERTGSHA